MLDLNPDQIKAVTIFANEKLMDILDGARYDGDDWFTVDASIPELANKIDINIFDYEDENGKVFIKAVAYEVVKDNDGNLATNCENWINLF